MMAFNCLLISFIPSVLTLASAKLSYQDTYQNKLQKTAKNYLTVGDFNKSYIGMTPPVFGLPLWYHRWIPDHNGGVHTINGASAPLYCADLTRASRASPIYGLVEGPEPKSLWIHIQYNQRKNNCNNKKSPWGLCSLGSMKTLSLYHLLTLSLIKNGAMPRFL